MKNAIVAALIFGAASFSSTASAQQITQTIAGTRLDVSATGEVTRIPDIAIISAGIVSRSSSASGALRDTADRMQRVILALKSAGVTDRDIQTSNVSLNPEYRYLENQSPQLVDYTASNNVTVRFRDIKASGKILDALVAVGANQINGPTLVIDKPETALDEARAQAIAVGRARADLYARSLGLRVARIVSVSESGGYSPPVPMAMQALAKEARTSIEPGEQKLQVNVAMTFELQ